MKVWMDRWMDGWTDGWIDDKSFKNEGVCRDIIISNIKSTCTLATNVSTTAT